MTVLGFRALQHRARLEEIDVLQPPLDDHRRHLGLPGYHRLDGSVGGVTHRIGGGNVHSLERLEPLDHVPPQGVRAPGADLRVRRHDFAHQLLPLPHRHRVHEGRHRLGIGERAHAAHEDQG